LLIPMLGRAAWARAEPSTEFFYLIPPHGLVTSRPDAIVLILRPPKQDRAAVPQMPGTYWLRLDIEAWRESRRLGRQLAKRWEPSGQLMLERMLSEPTSIEIPDLAGAPECRGAPLLLPSNGPRKR
jgi:hypothetical protein